MQLKNSQSVMILVVRLAQLSSSKQCQMVFSRFLSMTIFIPADNTRHSEKPGQNPDWAYDT
jgi:hypothetical protein